MAQGFDAGFDDVASRTTQRIFKLSSSWSDICSSWKCCSSFSVLFFFFSFLSFIIIPKSAVLNSYTELLITISKLFSATTALHPLIVFVMSSFKSLQLSAVWMHILCSLQYFLDSDSPNDSPDDSPDDTSAETSLESYSSSHFLFSFCSCLKSWSSLFSCPF